MDATHFGDAYGAGLQRTVKFLLSRGVPYEVVSDIAQSAWLRGWERIGQLRDESMILPWINTIALNHFRRTLRTTRQEEAFHSSFDERTVDLNLPAIDLARIMEASAPKDRALLKAQLDGRTAKELAEGRCQ